MKTETKKTMLLDKYCPVYDFKEESTVKVQAPADAAYRAIMEFTMAETPLLVRILSFLRSLPEKMVGRNVSTVKKNEPYLAQECRDFFTELENQPPDEYVFGLIVPGDIGRIWKKTSELNYRPSGSAECLAFNDTAYLKVVMAIFIKESREPDYTLVLADYRIRALSPQAKKQFTPYWRIIGPFSHYIQKSMLKAIKKRAETASAETRLAAVS
jgi:hypothetical protein